MQLKPPVTNKQLLDGRYRITQSLATGGMGKTYLAEDTKRPNNPLCVVKKLKSHRPEILGKAKELLARESNILEKLGEHSQIPRLLAYFEARGEFYLVQEYIEGKTLAEEFDSQQVWSEIQVINLLSQLLEILDFVHDRGVIHRDIKPTNIISRKKDNKLVLIDFGAVKEISNLGNQATIICTEGYAPNEQYEGNPRICSDIYAVGIIGIQALTGICPSLETNNGGFELNERDEIIWQNRIKVGKPLADILTKMVRQNKLERYQSAKEVQRDLEQLKKTKEPASTIQLTKQVSCLQKLKLPLFLAISILIIGFMSIFLAKKNSESIFAVPQLSLQGKIIHDNLHLNSQIDPIKNTYYTVYLFNGRKDKQVVIELNSDEFDTALSLLEPDGRLLVVNDDISPHDFDSRIVFIPPEDGKYQLIVRASQAGEMGNYQLTALEK